MPRKKSLLWQFYPYYLSIILLSLFVLTWYASTFVKRLYLDRTAEDLRARSRLVGELISDHLIQSDKTAIQALCDTLGRELACRITVVSPSGEVIGDSEEDPAQMENHADRPEIREALMGDVGISTRYSYTLSMKMMYVAVSVQQNGTTLGVVRTSLPVTVLSQTLVLMYRRIVLTGFLVAVAAALVSLVLARRIKKPLEELRESALRFGRGDLEHRLYIPTPEEFNVLAGAMNQMAAQLRDRLKTITDQRNELESILASMIEGVLVIDTEERILRFNQAAGDLFGMKPEEARARSIQEVIRNIDLLRFIRKTLFSDQTDEREIVLRDEEERFLRVYGTILRNEVNEKIGALIVLNDITRLKRLENIRRDFVANVSHELKTPITAIKGSVETLKDGACDNVKDTQRFLDIITKHSDRLNTIIEDLMSLSRIEQEAEKKQLILEAGNLKDVLDEAVSVCQNKAAAKRIKIELDCTDDVKIRMNPPLLEEAIINLVDNAIKYSDVGSTVRIEGMQRSGQVIVNVQDWGMGIPREHLPRIFERFYRVDKARSRKLGGTGLGLAIVKHIVQAHGGSIAVESTPGQGSIFTLHLPLA